MARPPPSHPVSLDELLLPRTRWQRWVSPIHDCAVGPYRLPKRLCRGLAQIDIPPLVLACGTHYTMTQPHTVAAMAEYLGFLVFLERASPMGVMPPNVAIDAMWHTHRTHPRGYARDIARLFPPTLDPMAPSPHSVIVVEADSNLLRTVEQDLVDMGPEVFFASITTHYPNGMLQDVVREAQGIGLNGIVALSRLGRLGLLARQAGRNLLQMPIGSSSMVPMVYHPKAPSVAASRAVHPPAQPDPPSSDHSSARALPATWSHAHDGPPHIEPPAALEPIEEPSTTLDPPSLAPVEAELSIPTESTITTEPTSPHGTK